jgi:uncharacterized protein YqgC (DUF456 family)
MEYSLLLMNVIVVLLLLGSVGMTLIGMPGNVLILLIALGYGYLENFAHINLQVLLILLGALVAGELVEAVAGAIGAKKEKASKRAVFAAFFGGLVGGIIGTGVIPVIGSIAGAILGGFAGSYLAEYSKSKDPDQASRVAQSVIKGQILGLVVKIAIATGMILYIITKIPWQM